MAKSILQDDEVWKDVKGYEGLYQVSNFGRVRSLSRTIGNRYKRGIRVVREQRILKPCQKDNYYLYVSLTKNRKRNNKYIHRLVADAFISKIDGKDVINHKDYDVTNNSADNLEWVTQKENVNHSIERMKHPKNSKLPSCTNEKYVGIRHGKFRVCVTQLHIDKQFSTLDEAVAYRDSLLRGWSCGK